MSLSCTALKNLNKVEEERRVLALLLSLLILYTSPRGKSTLYTAPAFEIHDRLREVRGYTTSKLLAILERSGYAKKYRRGLAPRDLAEEKSPYLKEL